MYYQELDVIVVDGGSWLLMVHATMESRGGRRLHSKQEECKAPPVCGCTTDILVP